MLLCFVVAGPQIVPVPFQKPQDVAVLPSVGQSQGLGQTGGGVYTSPLHPPTTTTRTALKPSTTALGNREGPSALFL